MYPLFRRSFPKNIFKYIRLIVIIIEIILFLSFIFTVYFLSSIAFAVFATRAADMIRPVSPTPLANRCRHLHKNRIFNRSPQNHSKSIFISRRSRRILIDAVSSAKCFILYIYMYVCSTTSHVYVHAHIRVN